MPPSTGSSLLGCAATSLLSTMSDVAPQKERRRRRSCAASSATSRGRSSPRFASRGSRRQKLLYRHRSINALAETINGLYKAEIIHRRGPWRSFEAVEFATLEWVDWFNHRRLLEPIETSRQQRPKTATTLRSTASHGSVTQTKQPPGNPGRFSSLGFGFDAY